MYHALICRSTLVDFPFNIDQNFTVLTLKGEYLDIKEIITDAEPQN